MIAHSRKNRTSVLNRYWQRHISDKNGTWCDMPPHVERPCGRCLHAAVPKVNFTFALTLMDKVGGWNDEKWIGPKFAACMRIYTKAACNKKCGGDPSLELDCAEGKIGKSATWVTEGRPWAHVWTRN